MEKENALARLLVLESKLTKEANSLKGETVKTTKEHEKALDKVCDMFELDKSVIIDIIR